jgi:murein DD-endopeptidase MepM/ murein hydrolase activator NlpD
LPAGTWLISRGPCDSRAAESHQCGYYEDQCGYDFILPKGDSTGVPVLAPQAGRVFYLGTRQDAGLGILLQHPDGRVSAYYHLSKIVVVANQSVAQGQVIGYVGGTGSVSAPHLHFHVQPNTVERDCIAITGLDSIDDYLMVATSKNRPWKQLVLLDPPMIPAELIPVGGGLPARILLAPNTVFTLPVRLKPNDTLRVNGTLQTAVKRETASALYQVVIAPQNVGVYALLIQINANPPIKLTYIVRAAIKPYGSDGIVLLSPTFVSPANDSFIAATASLQLCWINEDRQVPMPWAFRVMAVNPSANVFLDSGWQSEPCWQTPANLASGQYLWKVFIRDRNGHMNRTNQRPWTFWIYR